MRLRKYIRIWVMCIIFTIVFASAAQAAELGTRVLAKGMSGEDVSELQQLLKRIGYFNTNVTGYYGDVTAASVKNFQAAYGLTRDGVAGLETIYRIKYENGVAADSFVCTRVLKKGMSGVDVQNLQEVLKRLGHLPASLKTTQYFGDQTLSGVLSFQKSAGLAVDGSVGPATRSAIKSALDKLNQGKNSGNNNSSGGANSNGQIYTVQAGDTLWLLSQKFNTTVEKIQQANNLSSTIIYVGQKLSIPTGKKENSGGTGDTQTVTVSYINYTVKAGDTIWSIANSYSIPQNDLMKANNFNSGTILYIGQVIKVPVYNVPVKSTPGPQYGELLDWWTEAQYVLKFNEPFTITDFYTGTTFKAVRTFGANHADCEPLTAADTAAIKKLWNQYHASYWTSRPVLISINGRKLAASMSASFHAGVDSQPNGAYVYNRSGDYGYGENYDAIKGNDADGHFDIHFLNSTTHGTGTVNQNHQNNVKIAAGLK
ncbi:MAG TPA: LysM peptidoglycan-binding domain-containing protein [Clostridiales bacterium]|nr:LysM peptidoglycan-binding domain-containing protein [Clostridiales bacterium]